MKFITFIKKNRWETLGFLLLIFCVLINLFPKDHIILGGDIVQVLNLSENFAHYYSEDWFRQAVLFYGIFYLLDKLQVSDTVQLSWYLGIFLLGSYASFLSFCRLVLPSVSRVVHVLSSLFYATNLYTLYIFTATWGYISYQSLYIFIPILVGLYIKVVTTRETRYIFWFLLLNFFASMGFSNPAFALALGIFFFVLTGLLFIFRWARFDVDTARAIVMVFFGVILVNLYWILPLVPQLQSGIQAVYTSEFVDLSERLEKTSNAIFDTIRLLPTSEQDRYFPKNFPYPEISWLEDYVYILAFLPFFAILFGFLRKNRGREYELYILFSALLLVFIVLVARVRFPFDTVNSFLFHLPGLNTLRGYDKTATFLPFILTVLMLLLLAAYEKSRHRRIFLTTFFVTMVLLALPFYAGGIQTKLSYILSRQKAKDFNEAKQSALVKIPDPYFSVAPLLRTDLEKNKIAMLPFSPGSSVGRVNLPGWKVNGPYVVKDLYGKQYVELYGYHIPGWMFSKEFENNVYDPRWITDLYGLLGVKYVFYHKDAKEESLEEMEGARRYLERVGALKKIDDNESFFLYTLDDKVVFPYLYSGVGIPSIEMSPEKLSERLAVLRKNTSALQYEQRGLRHIAAKVGNMKNGTRIFLNESTSPLWRAVYISPDGTKIPLRKDDSVLYANAWIIDGDREGGYIEIDSLPVRLLGYGQLVSGIAIISVVFGLVWTVRKRKDNPIIKE